MNSDTKVIRAMVCVILGMCLCSGMVSANRHNTILDRIGAIEQRLEKFSAAQKTSTDH